MNKDTKQVTVWRGRFGKEYTDRNVVDPNEKKPIFKKAFGGLKLKSALEVGCNRGHNLVALADLFGFEPVGVEPNPYARRIARQSDPRISVLEGTIFALPFRDAAFDLTFTSGVLIHIKKEDLPKAIKELYRTSRKYLFCSEYYDPKETEIHYRGHDSLLWKRDFKAHFLKLYPKLKVIRSGHYGEEIDHRMDWWLFKK